MHWWQRIACDRSLAAKDKWPIAKAFASSVAEEMVATVPQAYIATMSKAKRTGKILSIISATTIRHCYRRLFCPCPAGAPVAVPLEWNELKGLKSGSQFTMKDVLKRLKNKKLTEDPKLQEQTIPSE